MCRPLRQETSISLGRIRDVLAAQRALWRAKQRLRREPIGALTMRHLGSDGACTGYVYRARALATAMRFAARFSLFRPTCLVKAMALRELLTENGINGSEIRIGVRRRDGVFAAHAWVRWREGVLGDDPAHVATFTEVDDIRVLGTL